MICFLLKLDPSQFHSISDQLSSFEIKPRANPAQLAQMDGPGGEREGVPLPKVHGFPLNT